MKKLIPLLLFFACTDDEGNLCIYQPTLSTEAVSNISFTSATLNGTIDITSDNCEVPNNIEQGFVYSTEIQPTIQDSQVNVNGNSITTTIEDLLPETTYYVRSFLTNNFGEFYGNEISFTTLSVNCGFVTDIHGNIYETILINDECWTKSNAILTSYSDGTPIPQVIDQDQWANLTTGAWCYYNNDPNNGEIYGKLYNWYAIAGIHDNDPSTPNKSFAPPGYHVPTSNEWLSLIESLGGVNIAGGKLKSISHWSSPNLGATNESQFTALPGGFAHNFSFPTQFMGINEQAWFWSQTEEEDNHAWFTYLTHDSNYVGHNAYDYSKLFGFSVRLVRD